MTYLQQLRSTRILRIAASILAGAALLTLPAIGQQGFPAGWMARADRGTADAVKFTESGGKMQFSMGRVTATFYNDKWTKSGNYTYSAHFMQEKKASHPVSYGLAFGGSDLGGENQMYTYFLIRQSGQFYIANRKGGQSTAVVEWTDNPAINKEGADGTQSNVLAVQVQGNEVIFSVNGKEVKKLPKGDVHTDGSIGIRIGHTLEMAVDQVKM
jgi:hypothetical protein